MSLVYFPSCNFTGYAPEAAQKISAYLEERWGVQIEGCCRVNRQKLTPADTAVYICNTCHAICAESSQAGELLSVWEVIAQDNLFPYPNYAGRKVTIQDCWRTYEKKGQQEAVREILHKMGCELFELEENYGQTRFCGTSLLSPPRAANNQLAPKRFVENAQDMFVSHTAEQQADLMQKHCQAITTDLVVCYCVPCLNGIKLGGKKAVHLLELLLPQVEVE